jgi:hypothetical protein
MMPPAKREVRRRWKATLCAVVERAARMTVEADYAG